MIQNEKEVEIFLAFPIRVLLGGGALRAPMPVKGSEVISERDARTASSENVNLRTTSKEKVIKKKKASHPPLLQREVIWSTSVSEERPLLMPPNATMPMTPRTTMIVP